MSIGERYFNTISTILWSSFIFLVGGVDMVLKIVLIAICIDYLTGLLLAIYNKKISSEIGYRGLIKKLGIIIAIIVANLADMTLGMDSTIRTVVCMFYISNEFISICENLGNMGVLIPKKFIEYLEQIDKNKEESL